MSPNHLHTKPAFTLVLTLTSTLTSITPLRGWTLTPLPLRGWVTPPQDWGGGQSEVGGEERDRSEDPTPSFIFDLNLNPTSSPTLPHFCLTSALLPVIVLSAVATPTQ